MADNVLEPYTFSFGDANPASNGCSSRVWVSPTSILQRKKCFCIDENIACVSCVPYTARSFVLFADLDEPQRFKNRIVLPRKVGRKEKDFVLYRPSLGGCVNLLYCFFWGIAAVLWMRYGYPLVLRLMKKVRSHIRPWMTAVLAVFMAVNMLTSALALARYDARTSGEAPNGQLEVFLDEHFDNARMERIYPNAKKVIKAE